MTSLVEQPPATRARNADLLEVRELVVEYGFGDRAARAVDGVDFAIREGEVLGLAGESGCGKTTIANTVMQILRPPGRITGGSILFEGEDIVGKSTEEIRRYRWRNVSMVLQSAMNALNPVMRIGDQFVDAVQAHEKINKRRALARAGELLELVGIDARRVSSYPHQLSGGMRQRVVIAMALALEPELIILDEPTTALDVVVQREILQQVDALKRDFGFAVLFITHDLSLLLEFADRISIMYAGEIVETASADRLAANPQHPYTQGLMRSFPPLRGPRVPLTGIPGSPPDLRDPPTGCRFHPRCPHCVPEQAELYQAADNRTSQAAHGRGGARGRVPSRSGGHGVTTAAPLEVRSLTKRFPLGGGVRRAQVHAVDDVSFELRPGTITALVGESGSGKSTVARLLAHLSEPSAGEVLFEGNDVTHVRRRRDVLRYRSQVQIIFQDPFGSLNPVKTVRHHIERPLRIHHIVPSRQVEQRVHELLRTVGLVPPEDVAAKYPHELSGGQRQRVAIARALAVEPKVVLADEPISMLDVSIRIGVLNLMAKLKEEQGIAFLYVTHDLASARYVADDILVMYAGQIVERGPIEDVLSAPLHPYTRLLLDAVPDPTTKTDTQQIELRKGDTSAAVDPSEGCRFRMRCPLAIEICSHTTPQLVEERPEHAARCHVTAPAK